MPQSIGVPRESPPRRTPSRSQRHNEQASISYSQVRKTTVTCPICQKQTSAKDVNQHIDSGCKDGLIPSPSIPRSMKAPKPSLHYKDYRDAELRKLLQKDGLPSSGDRQTLIRRLSEWIKRYNANIDEGDNKSTLQLARELGEWERNVNAAKPASFTNTGRHEETSETQQERLRHSRKYHDEYADMIERVRKRKRSSRDAGQVPDGPGSSEINNNAK
ncbi:hypothetical protein PhCBS80983_g00987 [Powellomyces hirtus]|uniref:RING-type E3 ubiquitin transferase n=1 Tax=Powellomyces hirtus TaxID=109895 RepID=A0A507EC60_9FUNG|nr:hypothetical protein PhCBS80983_g00987 [Powellomyces hirtus]